MPLHLLADIGGTNCRIAWQDGNGLRSPSLSIDAAEFASVEDAFAWAIAQLPRSPDAIAIAAAGPVSGGICTLTNGSWHIDAAAIGARLSVPQVRLVNDIDAIARGLPHLSPGSAQHLGGPLQPVLSAPVLVLGIGTGIGSAILLPDGNTISGEAGQASLSAATPEETAVVRTIAMDTSHLPAEAILAASGIPRLYAALGPENASASPQDIISRVATDRAAAQTMALYTRLLGRFAGNAVLTTGARGGLYLASDAISAWGGAFDGEHFYRHFLDKGRFAPYMAQIPVSLIPASETALTGLAVLLRP